MTQKMINREKSFENTIDALSDDSCSCPLNNFHYELFPEWCEIHCVWNKPPKECWFEYRKVKTNE